MKKINFLSLTVMLFLVSHMAAQEPVRWDYTEEAVYDNPGNKFSGHANIFKEQAKELKKYADDFVFIEGGPTKMGSILIGSFTDTDSTLLTMSDLWLRVTVSSFFMCQHEVTNAEYRAFVDWVKLRTAYEVLSEAYPASYLRADGSIDESVPINWTDTAIINQLFLPNRNMFNNKPQIDTRKLIYKGIAVYPDTAAWNKLKLWDMDTYCQSYFRHPQYDDYPVVGVSWEQAKLYADWRSDRLNEQYLIAQDLLDKPSYFLEMDSLEKQLREEGKDYKLFPGFRLPTEAEWIYAAMPKEQKKEESKANAKQLDKAQKQDLQNKQKDYCFEAVHPLTETQDFKSNIVLSGYNANYGPVWDQHGLQLKAYGDDGAIACTTVKSYQPNNYGLYDMAGNVAEWVFDICSRPSAGNYRIGNYQLMELCALFDTAFLSIIEADQIAFFNTIRDVEMIHPVRGNYFAIPDNNDTMSKIRPVRMDSLDKKSGFSKPEGKTYGSFFPVRRKLAEVKKQYDNHEHRLYHNHEEEKLKEICAKLKANYLHDKDVYERMTNPSLVKGGSWADPLVYLNPGTKTIKSQKTSSARIGFRLAMDIWQLRE